MLTWSEMTKLVQILQADWVLAEFSALAVTDCPCVPRLSLCAMKENICIYIYMYIYIYIFKYVYIYKYI